MTSVRRDIYKAIMIAAAKGVGLRLTADEVFDLSMDDAVSTRAANALTEAEWGGDWDRQKPWVTGTPAQLACLSREDAGFAPATPPLQEIEG